AMRFWALQHGPYVEVLEPAELREEIKESVNEMWEKYND
ncbi:WYL domain-containing protein, partial [bacterium]|nr:WYL domain-containing protein [bacterium]